MREMPRRDPWGSSAIFWGRQAATYGVGNGADSRSMDARSMWPRADTWALCVHLLFTLKARAL